MPEPAVPATRIWDLPTRLFHWVLAAAVIVSVVSGQIGGNAMVWHFRSGYLVFGLLLFRLAWGLVGGRWSRFASFVHGPGTVLRYLRGQSRPGEHLDVGHNPLGALSVCALLTVLMLQVGTGLVAEDDVFSTGPLNRFVSGKTAGLSTDWHSEIGKWILVVLVVVHLAAIVFYRFGRDQDLVKPMLTGDKALPPGVPASADSAGTRLLALALAGLCAAAVAWVVALGG